MATKTRGRAQQAKRVRAGSRKQTPARPLPVYFLSLTLENVRCFGPKQTLKLSDEKGRPARWTVILGNNGLGKTTLLQALSSVEPARDELFGGPALFPRGYLQNERLPWWPVRHPTENAWFFAKLNAGQLLTAVEPHGRQVQIDYQLSPKGPTGARSTVEPIHAFVCYGYAATRRMGAGSLSTPKKSHPSDSLFFEDVPLRNAEEWLLQADYAASKESPKQGGASQRRDRIKQLLIDLLPEVTDLRFALPDASNPAARVEVQTPYGWVAMRSLSLGYRTLIAWMVDLASRLFERYPESPNPLAEPAVVLVDEIDLHLHPTWQRQLIGYLTERFPNTQFIVTAHSPLVVQSATDANIVILKREGDHVVIDNDVESIRGWRVDQILTSDLFGLETARPPQLEKLLEERTALLSKPRLTPKDKARLRELESKIGPLPTGETKTEREALDLIQRAAERMRDGRK
ncbi:AAA family ATPase [Archangium lansingense]|uniref:AAA family ATPase n=1 Tax=Archangium lansingense TaxID=2995310 RepID=A0ABT4APC5_9BACT|nr:AAA family ATPase [Archangium lansinium]MCY1083515.1 AAA family ATPase [Archangium lansinium]